MTRTLRVHVTQSALDTDTERRMVTARPPVIIIADTSDQLTIAYMVQSCCAALGIRIVIVR
jgi:hypothetical protein